MGGKPQHGWRLLAKADVQDGIATFPSEPDGGLKRPTTTRVLIKSGIESVMLRVGTREGATGNQVHVRFGVLSAPATPVECTIWFLSESEYQNLVVRKTPSGRWAVFGLLIGVAGIAIDASFKIGSALERPLYAVTQTTHAWLLGLASVLQIVGLFIVFTRSLRKGDFA